jgi:hypothetical protein
MVDNKAESLSKIATDSLKNKVVLDPVKHRKLREISSTIAEKLVAQGDSPRKEVSRAAQRLLFSLNPQGSQYTDARPGPTAQPTGVGFQ